MNLEKVMSPAEVAAVREPLSPEKAVPNFMVTPEDSSSSLNAVSISFGSMTAVSGEWSALSTGAAWGSSLRSS